MTRGRLTTFIYTLALRAFPRAHRAEYADEMIDTFTFALEQQHSERRVIFVAIPPARVPAAPVRRACVPNV